MQRIPWPKHGYTAETQDPAMRAICEAKYHIALIASEEPAAYSFARAAGIPLRVGFHNGLQKPLKSWWARRQCTRALYRPAVLSEFPRHEVQTQFALGDDLHAENGPSLDVRRLRDLIVDHDKPDEKRPLLQLTKKWLGPERSLREVANWLQDVRHFAPWRIVAAENERFSVEPIARQAALSVEYFADVRTWKEAIAAASVLLTPDTGAAHVAGMIGTPVVDIFERQHFERNARRWAPWAAPSRLLKFPDAAAKESFAQTLAWSVAALSAQCFGSP